MSKNEELKKHLEEEINNLMIERRKRLNEAIKAKHFTLVQLEELIGVAKSSIQRYLTGETTEIPIDFFEKIAAVTDTPVEYLTCFEKEKNAPIVTNQDDLTEVIKQLTDDDEKQVKEFAKYLILKKQAQSEPDN